MATIKKNGNFILLKSGKVSCSCCAGPVDCCMYPAQALFDGLYSYQDLPDTLIQPAADGTTIVFTRLNPPQISEGGLGTRLSYYHGIDSFDQIVGVGLRLTPDPQQIFQWEGSEVPNEDEDFGECLLSIQTFQPDPLVWDELQDQFADTYTITTSFSSGTVTRQGLCLWNGVDGNGCPLQLIYGGFGGDPETEPAESGLKWSVSFLKFEFLTCIESFGRLKSGSQNSPIGTYDISYASEGPESATVS